MAAWPRVAGKMKGRERILFLDYDGTLTRLVSHPADAVLSPARGEILKTLARSSKTRVALVSGRSLRDLSGMFSAPGIFYAGNHGLEIKGPGISFVHPAARKGRPVLRRFYRTLLKTMKPFNGVCVENKGLSLSIHYRACHSRRTAERAHAVFLKTFHENGMARGYRLSPGKKVWDLTPDVPWHKGAAVKAIIKKINTGAVPVYIGDDTTDEDAFPVVRKRGLAVRVGSPGASSKACYFLKSPAEVFKFLKRLLSFE